MSLQDLGIFPPWSADRKDEHYCWKCGRPIEAGVRWAFQEIETSDQTGSSTVRAELVCATCHLRGCEIQTPVGRLIVERVKDGVASPYPVHTTNHQQWTDAEVRPC